jgi:hypothetical protein
MQPIAVISLIVRSYSRFYGGHTLPPKEVGDPETVTSCVGNLAVTRTRWVKELIFERTSGKASRFSKRGNCGIVQSERNSHFPTETSRM